ncbi:hypothetical protein [Cellulomonas chengniuliangii]|uniref:DUF2029 domain-containing protein n=1 Tax=Cellulomonas chengniuliangii TaxID=2968084 RepID=A0ABY5KZB6_9CELL|nr:hypothetical protein [Cellulomonas chengniuliangii]MCC2308749.1 hypothetical protein [Cellulomonas chengniuliangii]UUI74500.1 hypothetical protein NP064_11930 [Cellulomonas chengniuliangii]
MDDSVGKVIAVAPAARAWIRGQASRASAGREWIVATVTVAAVAALAWFRVPPVARANVWAEDGAVFLTGTFDASPWQAVLQPYDGYYHLLPRAWAEAITAFAPTDAYALAVTAASCAVAGAAAGLVYVCSQTVTHSTALRLAFAAVTALAPTLPIEVLGNLANLHWFLLWLIPWILLYIPRTWTTSVALGAVALVSALTEVQALYFVPLAVWRWRERRGWPVRIGLLAGLVAQLLVDSDRAKATGPVPAAAEIVGGYLVNTVGTIWWGSAHTVTWAVAEFGWWTIAAALIPSVGALLLVLWRGTSAQRVAAIVFPAASLVIWCTAVVVNRSPYTFDRPDQWPAPEFAILRYSPVPSMFLLAGLLLAVTVLRGRREAIVALVLAVPLSLALVTSLVPRDVFREQGTGWEQEVEQGRMECTGNPALTDSVLEVTPPGWQTRVPCAVLEDE